MTDAENRQNNDLVKAVMATEAVRGAVVELLTQILLRVILPGMNFPLMGNGMCFCHFSVDCGYRRTDEADAYLTAMAKAAHDLGVSDDTMEQRGCIGYMSFKTWLLRKEYVYGSCMRDECFAHVLAESLFCACSSLPQSTPA